MRNWQKESLPEDSKRYKKINYDDLVKEKYEMKEYFKTQNLHQARFLFRLSSLMVDGIRTHHSSKYRRRGIPLSCPSCSIPITTKNDNLVMVPIDAPRDDVRHIMTEWVKYEEMKENTDIFNSESDLISFFQDVLKYREENNQMWKHYCYYVVVFQRPPVASGLVKIVKLVSWSRDFIVMIFSLECINIIHNS